MKKKWRRYEVLLPQRFNDGSRVPKRWLAEAVNEIINQFGAVSFDKGKLEGRWLSDRKLYRDILSKLVIDMLDTSKNRLWMRKYKSKWKKRLEQLELWMVSYGVEVE
jgi:hypothetical protein